ncbi:hypothetical protein [Methanococcoides alaskense]|uniref:Uncharacterized protein n=1 Tax=Methanococcoides alaskense TaxID=325778 RepID=A0AA90ZAZ6_9EURY|nr:hypothetical protein [Methanococcoides alaskense]MDA0525489.1 hypothetical protein [Methanococcoides alaskense]MDR6221573.1 hypothetical protein [Methanococcoides alaskense]
MNKIDISEVPWSELSDKDKKDRISALEILRAMRQGELLSSVTQVLGKTEEFAIKHLGKSLIKSDGRWVASDTDNIQAEMQIYESDKGYTTIIITNSEDRSLLGRYFAYVHIALDSGEPSVLDEFKDVVIVDAKGKQHKLETDLATLYEIDDAMVEPEFFEIYKY